MGIRSLSGVFWVPRYISVNVACHPLESPVEQVLVVVVLVGTVGWVAPWFTVVVAMVTRPVFVH